MGISGTYTCPECGHATEEVTADFDHGMSGEVVTPVVCAEHGLQTAETGLCARDDPEWTSRRANVYPCPECGAPAPLWDRRTCPHCGRMGAEDEGWVVDMCWD